MTGPDPTAADARGDGAGGWTGAVLGPQAPGAPSARAPSARAPSPGAAGRPALIVEHLTKRFGARTAVDDLSLTVFQGEVFGFLGPNGAGKTTTVRTLGTLLTPTAGSAVVAGLPLSPANGVEIRQRIAIMTESPGLYLRLTVRENLEYFAGLYSLRDPRQRIQRALTPVLFVALPLVNIIALPALRASAALDKRIGLSLFYMLLIPALVPAALAAYAVVGEREQGTLEPVLTTPVRREEFLIGKAVAVLIPTVLVSYVGFGVFLAAVKLFAQPAVAAAVFHGPNVLDQVLFTPLLAGWAIWAGIAISARASDVRVAQQLGVLASLPPLAVTALMAFGVIQPTLALGLGVAAVLLLVDGLGWRLVSMLFDRERLVTGPRT